MSDTLIVIENKADWEPFYPSENIVSFEEYLEDYASLVKGKRVRVINLCRNNRYLSVGYYCSLLAEARGHSVIPSVRSLNDLGTKALYRIQLDFLTDPLSKKNLPQQDGKLQILSFFGNSTVPEFSELCRKLFELFACPILEISLRCDKEWKIESLKILSHHNLNDADETAFAQALDEFSKKIWRKGRFKKPSRYDLAILHDPEEKLPPSDRVALKKFIAAGKSLGIDTELITPKDYQSLPEYDGLFIRSTTAINHFTYRFAKRAEAEGMVVIDDPTSILRCTNKVYLADLFRSNKIGAPQTELLHKGKAHLIERLEEKIAYPIVLKIPDGSFSVGVEKVENRQELIAALERLFAKSTLLLAQQYIYTEYDWRIGILNDKPIYACRYYMVRNHWQIYQHSTSRTASGKFETLPVFEAPKGLVDMALRATKPIGNGFYGVDVKYKDGKAYVIEINDNPSIDSCVEDKYLGDELYNLVMGDLLRRMQARRTQN